MVHLCSDRKRTAVGKGPAARRHRSSAGEGRRRAGPGDVRGLAEAIRRPALEPALRSSLGRRDWATVVEHFSRSRMGREARATYRDLVAGGAALALR